MKEKEIPPTRTRTGKMKPRDITQDHVNKGVDPVGYFGISKPVLTKVGFGGMHISLSSTNQYFLFS